MASADLTVAVEVTKLASRDTYGIRRNEPTEAELLKLYNKQMILWILGDPACLEELTDEEQTLLESTLILKT